MTPKEKAERLVDKYWLKGITNDREIAKQCALIAVKEVALILNGHHKDAIISPFIEYWKEVKKELEKI